MCQAGLPARFGAPAARLCAPERLAGPLHPHLRPLVRTGPVLVLLVVPAVALIAGAVALLRSFRLQALQADGSGRGNAPAGPRERRDGPVKAGCR